MSLFNLLNLKLVVVQKLLILFFCALPLTSNSQSNDYIVKKKLYTQLDGLPDKNITCGLEDQNGFIWFGTKNGLCRFDGKEFLLLTVKSHGLYNNNIIDLSSFSNYLIITYGEPGTIRKSLKKREVLDINKLKITSPEKTWSKIPFMLDKVVKVFNTSEGELGFITTSPNSIWLLSEEKGFFRRYENDKTLEAHRFSKNDFVKIFMNQQQCFIKSNAGKIYLTKKNQSFSFNNSEYNVASVSDSFVILSHQSSSKKIDFYYKKINIAQSG